VHAEHKTRVYVYPEFKRRIVFSHPSNSHPDVDEWPILYRRDVPSLTDAEWVACPGEGWAEPDNRARLKRAFPDYWVKYQDLAELAKKRQAAPGTTIAPPTEETS
jgi:hypothetical protein